MKRLAFVLFVLSVLFSPHGLTCMRRRHSTKARRSRSSSRAKAGDIYDLYPRLVAEFMRQAYSGKPEHHHSKRRPAPPA